MKSYGKSRYKNKTRQNQGFNHSSSGYLAARKVEKGTLTIVKHIHVSRNINDYESVDEMKKAIKDAKSKSINDAIKRFNRKVWQAGILTELKKRKKFVTRSERKREKKMVALKRALYEQKQMGEYAY